MNTEHFLSGFKTKKDQVAKFVSAIRLVKMLTDNLSEFIPKTWTVTPMKGYPEIDIVAVDSEKVTIEDFKKLTSKLAKALRDEPSVYIDERQMMARFWIYPTERLGVKTLVWGSGVCVEIQSHNAEKCEITYKLKMQKIPVLTGYCKALSEKSDWAKVN